MKAKKEKAEFAASQLYVVARGSHSVRVFDPSTGAVGTLVGSGAPSFANGVGTTAAFNAPRGAELDAAGARLFVADTGNHVIRAVAYPGGAVSTLAGSGGANYADGVGLGSAFSSPRGLALDSYSGNLLVADSGNQ